MIHEASSGAELFPLTYTLSRGNVDFGVTIQRLGGKRSDLLGSLGVGDDAVHLPA